MRARPKANYAARESGVGIEWHKGASRCTDARFETDGDRLDRKLREGQIDQAFLDGLDTLIKRRITTSAAASANNFAPKVIDETGLGGGFTRLELVHAMRRLFRDDRLRGDTPLWQKPNRHWASGLARTGFCATPSEADCATPGETGCATPFSSVSGHA
jgi:hypothetical protein